MVEVIRLRLMARRFESRDRAAIFLASIWDGRLSGEDYAELRGVAEGRVG